MTKTRTKSVGKRTGIGSAHGHAVLADLVALKAMTVPELREKWAAIFDTPAPNTSRQNLELRLGYRIQEFALGGIGRDTRRTLDALTAEVASGEPGQIMSDPRRPMPGTKLVREWNGVEHTVTVLPKGFEWQGRRYKSLSGAARAITGANWNGWKFFGFTPRPRIRK
ncbi:DUF2924 domain-containing protein [Tritonibacter horizontis]|uniref:DUF2924 domain-containing protein n=1 Tax=Tritonibacter horizontis TaxID=1768241 RepID=A0A132BQ97_9RHOB|nr:DUF2924 domain-containing protein [Tritonibacter horizontis]KUP90583.1 hypothetical protein TRIHO_44480 [Tritonibacter horizontis]